MYTFSSGCSFITTHPPKLHLQPIRILCVRVNLRSVRIPGVSSQAPSTPSPSPSNGPTSAAVTSPLGSLSVLPNKSTLFGGSGSSNSNSNSLTGSPQPPAVPQTQPSPKPVPNHGKPNLAPKPPGMQLNTSVASNNNGSGRVARHHSMRSPR